MSDIIKLLPDSVANQIAAGEVVQRPASAVKELLENSLDAGATNIRLIIRDGGSTLMQVIDNGGGMSETDARMCWERHATSKINTATDIYALQTFGFRGEALASIAAVAQVEMKTRRPEDDAATYIRIEGSRVLEQTLTTAPEGTSISIKNLFFNIPARRNFLKSVTVETRHIMEEFQRQALAHPGVAFQLFNNGNEVFDLKATDLEQRIRDVLGISKPLLDVREETEIVGVGGFIGSPELARKTKGDQYFFVNGRFIRSPYFNHAVQGAYEGLVDEGSNPLFVLHLHVDPSRVDVNVHPTKTEVKFEDDRHIYNIIKAAVRKTLGTHILRPDSDMFGDDAFAALLSQDLVSGKTQIGQHSYASPQSKTPSFNPFTSGSNAQQPRKQDWTKILGPVDSGQDTLFNPPEQIIHRPEAEAQESVDIREVFQFGNQYLAARINDQLFVIDPHLAHEKVLFEKFRKSLELHQGSCQQLLFPRTTELNPSRLHLLLDLLDEFRVLGFDISHFGGNAIIINGLPPELNRTDETAVIERMLEDFESTQGDLKLKKHDSLALSLARQTAIAPNTRLEPEMQKTLLEQLFACEDRQLTFDKKPLMVKIGIELLYDLFRRQKPG